MIMGCCCHSFRAIKAFSSKLICIWSFHTEFEQDCEVPQSLQNTLVTIKTFGYDCTFKPNMFFFVRFEPS